MTYSPLTLGVKPHTKLPTPGSKRQRPLYALVRRDAATVAVNVRFTAPGDAAVGVGGIVQHEYMVHAFPHIPHDLSGAEFAGGDGVVGDVLGDVGAVGTGARVVVGSTPNVPTNVALELADALASETKHEPERPTLEMRTTPTALANANLVVRPFAPTPTHDTNPLSTVWSEKENLHPTSPPSEAPRPSNAKSTTGTLPPDGNVRWMLVPGWTGIGATVDDVDVDATDELAVTANVRSGKASRGTSIPRPRAAKNSSPGSSVMSTFMATTGATVSAKAGTTTKQYTATHQHGCTMPLGSKSSTTLTVHVGAPKLTSLGASVVEPSINVSVRPCDDVGSVTTNEHAVPGALTSHVFVSSSPRSLGAGARRLVHSRARTPKLPNGAFPDGTRKRTTYVPVTG